MQDTVFFSIVYYCLGNKENKAWETKSFVPEGSHDSMLPTSHIIK